MMIEVTLARGRDPERIAALGQELTRAAQQALGVKPETVRVIVRECDPEHWFVGGRSFASLRAAGER